MGISYNIISYDNLLLGNVLDLLKNIDIRTVQRVHQYIISTEIGTWVTTHTLTPNLHTYLRLTTNKSGISNRCRGLV